MNHNQKFVQTIIAVSMQFVYCIGPDLRCGPWHSLKFETESIHLNFQNISFEYTQGLKMKFLQVPNHKLPVSSSTVNDKRTMRIL